MHKRFLSAWVCPCAIAFALFGAAGRSSAAIGIQDLGTLGTPTNSTFGYAMSSNGANIVGQSGTPVGNRAFRWRGATGMQGLGLLSGTDQAFAQGVNTDGTSIVGSSVAFTPRPTLWTLNGTTATPHDLGLISGGSEAYAQGISGNASVIVGTGQSFPSPGSYAVRWTPSGGGAWTPQSLGYLTGGTTSAAEGISRDGSTVIGEGDADGISQTLAWRWTTVTGMQRLGVLSGGSSSHAFAADNDGNVIVGKSNVAGANRAFRWTASGGPTGAMENLGVLSGTSDSTAYAVSDDGSLVVGQSGSRAFLWSSSLGMVDLNSYFSLHGISLAGWQLRDARGISADGNTFFGNGTLNGVMKTWVVTIPAPGAIATISFAGIVGSRRRRNSPV